MTVLASGAPTRGLGIPALESLEQEFLRIPSAPGGDLVDGFAGTAWTFHPDIGPGATVLSAALARVAADAG